MVLDLLLKGTSSGERSLTFHVRLNLAVNDRNFEC
jgi:hypothetical protein